MFQDFFFQASPVPTSTLWLFTPHIKLKLSLARWRANEGLVWTITGSEFT